MSRLHASLFDAPWDAESFRQTLGHPGAIAFVAHATTAHAGSNGRPEWRRGAGHSVPSPITPKACLRHDAGEGQGGGYCRTLRFGVPPTPNPSPRFGGAPSARRGGQSARGRRQLCGFIVGRLAADEAEILTLGVAPDWQHLGIGRRLVEALCHESRKRGARRLYLEVAAGNAAALALYRRLGFRESGRRAAYYARAGAPAEDAINLFLPLAGSNVPCAAAVDDAGRVTYKR